MAKNEELTTLLQGKAISGTSDSNGKKTVTFDDGSVLSLAVENSSTNSASTGGGVEDVDIDGSTLRLHLNGGGSTEFTLAGESGAVELRDKDDAVVYSN